MNKKVRVGLMLDSYSVPHWVYRMIERIQRDGHAEIALVISNQSDSQPARGFWDKIKGNHGQLFYLALLKIEGALYRPSWDPFAETDLRPLLSDTPELTVQPVQKRYSDYFTRADTDQIKSCELDVLVRLGFRILRGEILRCARLGVWSYHHGDNDYNRGGPAGFWEVLQGWQETGSILQVLTEDLDGGEVLYKSQAQTDLWSLSRNRANLYWKSLSFLPRKIAELHNLGEPEFTRALKESNQHPSFYTGKLYKVPRGLELSRLFLAHLCKYAVAKIRSLFYFDQWILLYDLKKKPGISSSFWRFKKIVPPKDRIWADPFAIYKDRLYHIFIEEMPLRSNKGHIAHMTIDGDGHWTAPVKIIEEPYHLSYPFVFEHEGAYYLVPETAENRTIDLYECVDFPNKWQRVKTLIGDISAVDATLHQQDGKWWLFANIRENKGASTLDELFLFHAEDLLDDTWHPHPQNPIVSDVRSARPAGRLFTYNGNLYRPSQDNSGIYGSGMCINHVTALTETRYSESCVGKIEPDWEKRMTGTHTLNFCDKLTVSDGLLRRARFSL
jgi:hypothetical protein